MSDLQRTERDLVLAPNEFAFIQSDTKGDVTCYVGPTKASLDNTDKPVIFDERTKTFRRVSLDEATTIFKTAPEGWYVVLKNPAPDRNHPTPGTANSSGKIKVGHKVNIAGPCDFALWPGQMCKIVKGHHLRSNQYLIVRVYDEEAAKENWDKMVFKTQTKIDQETEQPDKESLSTDVPKDLATGKIYIVKGTEISFFMPPTGIEVVSHNGEYIREAVTLERLEYCVLLDESGNKRYVRGPNVVFPSPTEIFVRKNESRKFKAIELNEISGIYVKVIAGYNNDPNKMMDEGEEFDYKVGEELFITGKDTRIYFPREEHAIIKYGDKEVHFAVAIPAGEGRYVMNRETGDINLVKGPKMLLPDPRTEVIVRRTLSDDEVNMIYPGNTEALQFNHSLREQANEQDGSRSLARGMKTFGATSATLEAFGAENERSMVNYAGEPAEKGYVGNSMRRKSGFSKPRTIELNTKYEGVPAIDIWTGYAILVKSKTSERKVVVGPATYLLGYDETVEGMTLSMGKPKTTDQRLKTGFLRVSNNKVSDIVGVETSDMVSCDITLSYRVNFEGNKEKWFDVENYVKFLCDHVRSRLSNIVKRVGIEKLNASCADIVRDIILGEATEEGRKGLVFVENGMRITDVEVLDLTIGDVHIAKMLTTTQTDTVRSALELVSKRQSLDNAIETAKITEQIENLRKKASLDQIERSLEVDEAKHEAELKTIEIEKIETGHIHVATMVLEDHRTKVSEISLARKEKEAGVELSLQKDEQDIDISLITAETVAFKDKMASISPQLANAINALGERATLTAISEAIAPIALAQGNGVIGQLGSLLGGTQLGEKLSDMFKQIEPPSDD